MIRDALSRSKLSLHEGSGGEFWIWRTLPNGDILSTIGPFRERTRAEIALVDLGGTLPGKRKQRASRWSDWEVWYRKFSDSGKPFRLYMTCSTRQNAAAQRDKLQREGYLVELREHR